MVLAMGEVGEQKTLQELRMLASVTLNCQVTKIVINQVLNCQNCNQCLKCPKSPGLSFQLAKAIVSIVKIVVDC